MKKLIVTPLFLLLLCFSQTIAAQDITCLSCDSIVRLTHKPTTIADVYMVLVTDQVGTDFSNVQFANLCQRISGNQTTQRLLSEEEVKYFVGKYGKDYLHIQGWNYFLTLTKGGCYGLLQVNGDGTTRNWVSLFTPIPVKEAEHFLIFMKKIGDNKKVKIIPEL